MNTEYDDLLISFIYCSFVKLVLLSYCLTVLLSYCHNGFTEGEGEVSSEHRSAEDGHRPGPV